MQRSNNASNFEEEEEKTSIGIIQLNKNEDKNEDKNPKAKHFSYNIGKLFMQSVYSSLYLVILV